MGFMYKGQKIPTGGGTDITAGDGLSKDGDTLNVDNPVHGIMTQAEFDALPETQKTSGTYFVDDGSGEGGGGGGGEVYTTEEQRIGTWIDGKPLYRKFYVRGQTSGSAISLESNTVIDVITGFGGYVTNSKYITAIPYAAGVDGVAIDYAARNLYLILSDTYTTVNSITLYVEYTKTTDTATTALASIPTTFEDSFPVDVVDDMMPPIMPITIGVADAGSIEEAKV